MKVPSANDVRLYLQDPVTAPLSLRQRRQQELRQLLTDTATQLFLEHGFDAVRVADIARACGVTEKTVFNHFPTKESLLVDRWEATIRRLQDVLSTPLIAPVDAALEVIGTELAFFTTPQPPHDRWITQVRRFSELVRSTPALLAHERQSLDRLGKVAAASLAERAGSLPDDPAISITAAALTGLWTVFSQSLHRHLPTGDPERVRSGVTRDLQLAADVLRRGL